MRDVKRVRRRGGWREEGDLDLFAERSGTSGTYRWVR